MLKFFLTFVLEMNSIAKIFKKVLKRKLATAALIAVSACAFATLGDGGGKKSSSQNIRMLSYAPSYNYKSFSLKTGYNYRGKTIINQSKTPGKYILLNREVTYQKGNASYILPMKKKLFLDKIKFNPAH